MSSDTLLWPFQYWGSNCSDWEAGHYLSWDGGNWKVRSYTKSSHWSVCVCASLMSFCFMLPYRSSADDSLFPGRRLAELIVELSTLLNSDDIRFFESDMWVVGSDRISKAVWHSSRFLFESQKKHNARSTFLYSFSNWKTIDAWLYFNHKGAKSVLNCSFGKQYIKYSAWKSQKLFFSMFVYMLNICNFSKHKV